MKRSIKIFSVFSTMLFLLFLNLSVLVAQEKAPEFQLADLNGKQIELKDLLKKGPVVVDFWATWCKPCVKSLPKFQDLYEKYKADSVNIIGINVDGPRNLSKVKPFVNSLGVKFPILIDENGEVLQRYRIVGIPATVIISPTGNIVKVHTGYRPGDEKMLEQEIQKLLKKTE